MSNDQYNLQIYLNYNEDWLYKDNNYSNKIIKLCIYEGFLTKNTRPRRRLS